jgi:outer membrane protein insertion porin family
VLLNRTYLLRICLVCLTLWTTFSCNYTKHLTDNQTLLKENTVELKSVEKLKNRSELESAILSIANPKPNSNLLDLSFLPKYKLWRYNNRINLYTKDTNHIKLIKRKVEKPSLIDTTAIEQSCQNIRQFLINQGHFYNTVTSELKIDSVKKTGTVKYIIEAGKSFVINDVSYEADDFSLINMVKSSETKSFLKKGEKFSNSLIGLERERVYKLIRNAGFFDFKTDNISFTIDTADRTKLKRLLDDPFEQALNFTQTTQALDNNKINILMHIKKSKDSTYNFFYRIQDIFVEIIDPNVVADRYQDHFTENVLDNIHFKYKSLPVNRKVITRNILFQSGDVYNIRDIELTVARLNQLGVFQFVNFRFSRDSIIPGKLNCHFILTVAPKRDIVGTTDLSTSDGDYRLGLGAGITYRNRNLAHGANQLSIRATYATEFRNDNLLTGTKKFYQSGNNLNFNTNISFPKFIVPFNQRIFNKRNLPYTILGLNYSFIQRIENYAFVNISGSFGYSWKETAQKSWRLNPAFLTVTQLPKRFVGNAFETKLQNDKYLQQIFSNNVIYGENTSFEYISKMKGMHQSFSTLKLGLEEAGALLSLVNTVYKRISSDSIHPIAQYLKLDGDARNYKNWKKMQWVNRVQIGIGMPVGRSSALPFIKQYSAGGAFSNRGFRARTLGPGRAADSSYRTGVSFIDRTGDIKFEANSEFRFNLLKLFSGAINMKGALFADAGNIWLFQKSTSIPGGEINANYLWQDIAISSGAGLRLDFSLFVIRVDLAFPIKQPQLQTNSGWAFDQLKLNSGIWNIAIGYPF